MKVLSNGLALNSNSSLAFLAIDSVRHMKLEAGAFSGHWDTEAKLRIGYVSSLVLSQNTFSFQSSPHIPSLVIEHATLQDIEPMAFNASLEFLTLKDVEIKMCRRNGFGGSIQALSMDRVDLNEVREGCINGSGSLRRLSVSNSRLGVIRHRGICGSIPTVTIRNCSVSLLQPNGLQLRTAKLDIYSSEFTSIMTRGLNVLANQIYLRKMVVDTLQGHALKALRTTENENDSPSIHILNLTVQHTYNGSLAFDPETNVELVHLSVGIPEPPVCPVERWVRQLTDTSETAPLGQTQKQMQTQLNRHWLCKGPSSTTPATAGVKNGGGESAEQDPHATVDAEETDDKASVRSSEDSDLVGEVIALLIVASFVLGGIGCCCCRGVAISRVSEKLNGHRGRERKSEISSKTGPDPISYTSITVTDSVAKPCKKGPASTQGRAAESNDGGQKERVTDSDPVRRRKTDTSSNPGQGDNSTCDDQAGSGGKKDR
ncbi:uncharacterized protein LOC122378384 isoform X2 [Amphibalanus amphitrite]|nr:uncharacterized protein LOC122378384 isoform X2 [Amphibalanus amphitrite]